MMCACQFDRKAADINAVQMQHRKDGRKTARGAAGGCFEHFGNFHRFDERIAGMTAPVVEVAGNDKRRVLGHQLFDAIFYQSDLFPAPMAKQSQVHIDAMKGLRPIGYCYFTMEQSAMLAVVHGNVFIVPSGDRIFAEDCVAMMAAIVNGVLAVGKIAPDRIGEEFVLRRRRPIVVPRGMLLVQTLHFLQEYHVGADVSQPVAQIVHGHAPLELREALMDVVGNNLEFLHFGLSCRWRPVFGTPTGRHLVPGMGSRCRVFSISWTMAANRFSSVLRISNVPINGGTPKSGVNVPS